MARTDEISSTEKLLELIRDHGKPVDDLSGDGTDAQAAGTEASSPPRKPAASAAATKLPITIGVDIRSQRILLAAVQRGADGHHELVQIRSVRLKSHMALDSADFTKALNTALTDFTSGFKKHRIWVSMPSANVEMRLLTIPHIPARQVPNAAKWAFRRETSLDETRDIFDFDLIGTTFDDGVQKTQLLAYAAPRVEVKQLQTAFQKAGMPLTGVSIVPFAIQNLLQAGWIDAGGNNVCSLFVGKDWSRIAIYANGRLMLGRDIKAGAHSIVEAIAENMQPGSDTVFDASGEAPLEMADTEAFMVSNSAGQASRLLTDFLKDRLPNGKKVDMPYSKAAVFDLMAAPLERIIRQVSMTIEHYKSKYDSAGVSKILISGDIAVHPWVVRQVSRHLDMPVDAMEPFSMQGDRLGGVTPPAAMFDRMEYLPAVGIALSDHETTPNFLFTHHEKTQVQQTRRFNRIAYSVFGVLFAALVAVFAWQTQAVITVRNEVIPLRKTLARFTPKLDRNMVSQFAGKAILEMKAFSSSTQRYIGPAVLTDVVNRTPDAIAMTSLTIDLGEITTASIKTDKRYVLIAGAVSAERDALETTLAHYIMGLKASPLFGQPEIKRQKIEKTDGKAALTFVLMVPLL